MTEDELRNFMQKHLEEYLAKSRGRVDGLKEFLGIKLKEIVPMSVNCDVKVTPGDTDPKSVIVDFSFPLQSASGTFWKGLEVDNKKSDGSGIYKAWEPFNIEESEEDRELLLYIDRLIEEVENKGTSGN